MGIRTLTRWVQWMNGFHPIDTGTWTTLKGTRVGIDIQSILYKARTEHRPLCDIVAGIIRGLRAWEIEPVVVFDGKTPREKQGTRSIRRTRKLRLAEEDQVYVTAEDRDQIKQLLYALGILCLNAEYEADSVLAYFARRRDFSAVITSDMDFLPRGIQHILLPRTLDDLTQWTMVWVPDLLQTSQLTYSSFVEFCVLLGCDYAPTVPTLTYQSAYWRIREGETLLEILASEGIRTPTLWETAVTLLRGEKDRWETLLSERQREKWANGPPPPEPYAEILRTLHLRTH